jgi:hypothetical protein
VTVFSAGILGAAVTLASPARTIRQDQKLMCRSVDLGIGDGRCQGAVKVREYCWLVGCMLVMKLLKAMGLTHSCVLQSPCACRCAGTCAHAPALTSCAAVIAGFVWTICHLDETRD